jgi:hypothetical protein
MKALYLILRTPAAKVYRWLRRHPRQVVLVAIVLSVAPPFFLEGIYRQLGTYLSTALLVGLVLFQISSSNRRRLENLLTRYMYQSGPAPVYNKQLLATIEFNFVAQNKTFESAWLIQKYGIIDDIRTFYVAKLARQRDFGPAEARRHGQQQLQDHSAEEQDQTDQGTRSSRRKADNS